MTGAASNVPTSALRLLCVGGQRARDNSANGVPMQRGFA